ncbi:Kelch repeat-containing protein [Leptospira ryugenii]|uniref:Kelch repeat-containing protein n=1 Tax=Leptospira ryugenii TaxID=1917863 RepID=UPI000D5A1BD6|nr:kelch motif-containing protein [Leptospira ryugenii]
MSLFLFQCQGLLEGGRSGQDQIFLSEIGSRLLFPNILLTSNPSLGSAISAREIAVRSSEAVWTKQTIPLLEIRNQSNGDLVTAKIEEVSASEFKIQLPKDLARGTYVVQLESVSRLLGKSFNPSRLEVNFDPEAPTVQSVFGTILDSSFFNQGYLDVSFNETVQNANLLSSYSLNGQSLGTLRLSSVFPISGNLYRLFFTGLPSSTGGILVLSFQNILDTAGNALQVPNLQFQVYGFKFAGEMQTARSQAVSVLLPSGQILTIGGVTGSGVSNLCELYNPNTKSSVSVGNLTTGRRRFTATLLNDGRVFIAGGDRNTSQSAGDTINTTEIFDPATNTFSNGPNLITGRMDHAAILLASGKVLIAGGILIENASPFLSTNLAEVYDPNTNTMSSTGNLQYPRRDFVFKKLADGNVYAFGGLRKILSDEYIRETEVFDEQSGNFTVVPRYELRLNRSTFFVEEFSDRILAFGAVPTTERLLKNESAFSLAASFSTIRTKFSPIAFAEEKIILFGGEADGTYVPRIDYYDIPNNRFTLGSRMLVPRIDSQTIRLPSGKVIVIGGLAANPVKEIEEYSYE